MTDRHLHCVYFKYDNPDNVRGECLLWRKEIERGYEQCCPRVVLRPSEVVTYFLKHEHYCQDWVSASEEALDYLEKVGWMNNYPDNSPVTSDEEEV